MAGTVISHIGGALASFRIGPRSWGRPRLVGCSVAHECPPSGLQPKARTSTDKQADVATQQKADVVISAKEKGAGDAKTEKVSARTELSRGDRRRLHEGVQKVHHKDKENA
ncbi:hypothetical protein HPB52_015199 [Rhipicephalus sanguineus]|uniref:Uncharacterized protein n=1 Tax=Rhipicephalus sanguineus TaxID=34632 RepID=A0A9D4PT32_RHISA|nr:hypothetical protein HPB52_015199 [Rhipicephalus sanguineus]